MKLSIKRIFPQLIQVSPPEPFLRDIDLTNISQFSSNFNARNSI
jgi:hypothetical protein